MMRDLNQEFSDNEHRQYAYDFDYRMHAFMMRRFEALLPRGRAIELGCYHGDFTRRLVEHYADLTVVEGASDLVEIARMRVDGPVRFIHSRFEDFEPDAPFDAAFLIHTLEHFDAPVAVLGRIRSWLAPRGRLFVAVPNAHAASRQIAVGMGLIPYASAVTEGEHLHGHRRTYSLDVLKNGMVQAGFRIEDSGGIMFKPLANFQLDQCLAQGIIGDTFLEGCYEFGKLYPDLCSSVFAVCSPASITMGGK
jgi:2-polyprenyl-3-methyl-5-hydroxy-6-metoxy-1,4-benzoquinol methylase